MMSMLKKLLKGESAQGMVEYALLIALLSLVAYNAIQGLGTNVNKKFGAAKEAMR